MMREGIPKRMASMLKTTGGNFILIQGWERRFREEERS